MILLSSRSMVSEKYRYMNSSALYTRTQIKALNLLEMLHDFSASPDAEISRNSITSTSAGSTPSTIITTTDFRGSVLIQKNHNLQVQKP